MLSFASTMSTAMFAIYLNHRSPNSRGSLLQQQLHRKSDTSPIFQRRPHVLNHKINKLSSFYPEHWEGWFQQMIQAKFQSKADGWEGYYTCCSSSKLMWLWWEVKQILGELEYGVKEKGLLQKFRNKLK